MDRDIVIKLMYSVVQFLKKELQDSSSSLQEEGSESVEVAIQCLETAYGVSQESTHLATSRPLYDVFKDYIENDEAGIPNPASSTASAQDKAEAEILKNDGNKYMRDEDYTKALECYTKAIMKDTVNAVYYCNRAAAYSKMNNFKEAIEDCRKALRMEPQYSKAYGRMGLAYSEMNKHREAKECYQKALEIEPQNENFLRNLQVADEKLKESQTQASAPLGAQPPSNPFAGLGGGFNLGGFSGLAGLSQGGGGTPDIQGLFNNPALMNMATQLMSDPNMQNMMSSLMDNLGGSGSSGSSAPGGGAAPPPPPPTQSGGGGMDALLNAGRHLAEQIQNQNPEIIDQLRNRMGGNNPPRGGPGDDQNPPNPPQS